MKDTIHLAKAVKVHRKKANLSQKALADYAGVGKTAVFDLEHGKTTMQFDTILKILNVLNITLSINTPIPIDESTHETS
ncbi:MAG: helix-turn-helix transcriptional regulator [Coxiellaceae bacterium]|nr:helix-turn-helix transcriptional regulator [Coxiellaceae bacterium]